MIHPHTEPRRTSELELGVFATQLIPRGTIIWVLDPFDIRLTPQTVASYPPMLRSAVTRGSHLGQDCHWVFCWDHARFVNHSCEPNCADVGSSFQITTRTLQPGEELTCDYSICGHFSEFACRCGAAECRGWIPSQPTSDGLENVEFAELLTLAGTLQQPLLAYAQPEPVDAWVLDVVLGMSSRSAARAAEVYR